MTAIVPIGPAPVYATDSRAVAGGRAVGTSIHCFFARGVELSPADLRTILDGLMAEHSEDVQILMARGQFSKDGGGWGVHRDRPGGGGPNGVTGEGPAGLGIDVHQRVVLVHSAERFRALYDDGIGVAPALRRILCAMARRLGASPRIAVAAGGFGDTDKAADLAYYEGGSFEEVVAILEQVAGPPARTWSELAREQRQWYFGAPQAES